jgi:hypothetical protein
MRKHPCCYLIATLYLLTWIGGWISHARQLQTDSDARWKYLHRRLYEDDLEQGKKVDEAVLSHYVHPEGPTSWVSWCVPILPGLLLADSGYTVGPLSGRGGGKLVLYYGFGSIELCTLWGWAA